jgi:hypothetical protein
LEEKEMEHTCTNFKIDYDLTIYKGRTLELYARCIECGAIDPVPEINEPDEQLDRIDPGYWLDNF